MTTTSTTSDQNTNENQQLLNDIILHEDDLTEQAKSRFPYHGEILRSCESYRRNIVHNKHMTRTGKHVALYVLLKMYTDSKRVLNYVAEHSEILNISLPSFGPLFLVGLPRTGTTLLQNLLACDPNSRCPLFTDMWIEIVPPITRSDLNGQKRRMIAAQKSMQQDPSFTTQRKRITPCHPVFPYEEDYFILRQAGFFAFFTTLTCLEDSDPDTWLAEEMKKDYAYDYHEIFLRMLNSVDAPRSHWLLKGNVHCFQLDTLLRHYPNAALIMTHRDLDEVLPSFCSLGRAFGAICFDDEDVTVRKTLTAQSLKFIDKAVECLVEFRTRQNSVVDQSHNKVFDVIYNDLIKDPIATVHRIYDHFGLHWSDDFESAMHAWLLNNPQGKQGRHTYSLSDCDLTHEDIQTRYADYINLFMCSNSSDTVKNNGYHDSSDNGPPKQE